MKGRHFSSDAEVIAVAETWLDGQASDFFEWLAKVSLVAVVCFLPGRAKDLSTPRYSCLCVFAKESDMCSVTAASLYYAILLSWLKGVDAVGVTVRGKNEFQCYRFQVFDSV